MMNMPILLHDHTSKDGSYLRSVQRYHHKQLLTCTQEGKMRPAFSRHKKTQSSAVRMREEKRHVSSRVCCYKECQTCCYSLRQRPSISRPFLPGWLCSIGTAVTLSSSKPASARRTGLNYAVSHPAGFCTAVRCAKILKLTIRTRPAARLCWQQRGGAAGQRQRQRLDRQADPTAGAALHQAGHLLTAG